MSLRWLGGVGASALIVASVIFGGATRAATNPTPLNQDAAHPAAVVSH